MSPSYLPRMLLSSCHCDGKLELVAENQSCVIEKNPIVLRMTCHKSPWTRLKIANLLLPATTTPPQNTQLHFSPSMPPHGLRQQGPDFKPLNSPLDDTTKHLLPILTEGKNGLNPLHAALRIPQIHFRGGNDLLCLSYKPAFDGD